MTRWDLRIAKLDTGQVFQIPPGARQVLIEGDIQSNATLQGNAEKLHVQISGSVKSGARVQLKGLGSTLEVKGGIDALILLDGCSLTTTDRRWLGPTTHIHTRGTCSKLHIAGKGNEVLFVEPDEQKDIEVRFGRDKQIVSAMPVMRSAKWLPHILPGRVPHLPPYDKRRGSPASYGGFTIPAFNEQCREYLKDIPRRLRPDCPYCSDLRTKLQHL